MRALLASCTAFALLAATPGAAAQCLVQKVLGPPPASSGWQNLVSLHQDRLLVPGHGTDAVVLERRGDAWVETAQLAPADGPHGGFGVPLDLGPDVAAVSSTGQAYGIYVFECYSGRWTQVARLRPLQDSELYDQVTLAISQDALVVGLGQQGALFFYERIAGEWRAGETVTFGHWLGTCVALDGRTVLAGALDGVHVFDHLASGWQQTGLIQDPVPGDWEEFAESVALSGDRALVGSYPIADSLHGHGYVFQRSGNEWLREASLTSNTTGVDDRIGFSVDLEGDRAILGAIDFSQASGRALVFEERAGEWQEIAVLTPAYEIGSFLFGHSVAVSGDNAAVADVWAGGYVYSDFGCAGVTEYCTTTDNSTNYAALISHGGSLRVSDNTFELRASFCPDDEVGFFYYGPEAEEVPFASGVRCVGSGAKGLFRFAPMTTHFSMTRYRVDFTAPPANAGRGCILPGTSWCFQFAFHDAGSIDFSSALRVTFGE